MARLQVIERTLNDYGQTHLLSFWKELDPEHQEALLRQLQCIDFKEANRLFTRAQQAAKEEVAKLDDRIKPIPPELFEAMDKMDTSVLESYRKLGLKEISEGHVAVLLLSGGQGTRLGVEYPKGMYSVGLPSGKTLFQIQAERIRRLCNLAKQETGKSGKICWYIMTNNTTTEVISKFLEDHKYFGLNQQDVRLFEQGMIPCFDFDGKLILDQKHIVTLSPDGNGGVYRALKESGMLEDMKSRGVKYVHGHSVDNILIKVADPVFVGYCVSKQADCGAKVVSKNGPNEAVGVVCQVDGKFQVVEYSEITEKTANLRDKSGNLVFNAGNICNHFFTTEFLERVANEHDADIKLHIAKKKVPYVNDKGIRVKPTEPNGIKIEKFIFDVFPYSRKFVTLEVPRSSEFSALKNADDAGKDCPSTSRSDLLALHKLYIESADGKVQDADVEISPLLSYAGENLETKVKGKTFTTQTVLISDAEKEESIRMNNGV
ncbi:unnamed protein product [Acanthoscelides obtectus]|nr:unnamed protein product [Acanthoscelides obtectus]CAK1663001.1 UDP-N-acetylhexosamine pyrophosphorylase-like protein 1 [Acanthoscelides obtectus]